MVFRGINNNMKKNVTKRDFGKFTKRNAHKRRGRDAARRELEGLIEKTNVEATGVKISSVTDTGRGYRDRRIAGERVAVGVYSSTKGGFGFVSTGEGRDIFIPAGRNRGAIDSDIVAVEYDSFTDRFGVEKTEGRVKKIVEYGRKTLIGTVREELVLFGRRRRGYALIFIPDEEKISNRINIAYPSNSRDGDKVEVHLNRASQITADVVRVFGSAYSFGANYEAHLAACGIEQEFSEAARAEAKSVSEEPVLCEGRSDRRSQVIFTIDGAGAKDLDDAVSVRRLKGGAWQLGVHIADVSHYVKERTPLDRAAMSRATSVYFTDKVVPMLPEVISNGSCSLNSGEDKYALSALINISESGELLKVKLEPSVIKSRVRGVYSEVNKIFDGTASVDIKRKYKPVLESLLNMRALYYVLKRKSLRRGALELESSEAEIILDTNGDPCEINRRERGEAEMMIEQFMLAANEAVARLLSEKEIPCVYRIHEPPPEDKLEEFVNYAHNLGFDASLISKTKASPADLSALLSAAKERGLYTPVSYTMLRSMSKARYSEIRHAHFGLGIEYYCHFTSPIRRLADLATHRIIHRVLFEGKKAEQYASYAKRAAAAASDGEMRAVSAERRIENMYKALYMSRFVGNEFDAVINSVTSFGLFVELENSCEGLVPISELDGAPVFEEKTLTIRSYRTVFHLADRVRVRLEEADVMRGKLRFSIIAKDER